VTKFNSLLNKLTPALLFLAVFVLHTVTAFQTELSLPNFNAFLVRILHTPAMLFFSDPFEQFTAMLIVNGAIAALIPVFVYKIAIRLGVEKPWQRILAALAAGICPGVIAASKYVSNDLFNLLFPCIIALIMLTISDVKNLAGRCFLSVLLAFVTTVMVFADDRMITVAVALIFAVITTQISSKTSTSSKTRKIAPTITFLVSLVIFAAAVVYLVARFELKQSDGLFADFDRFDPKSQFASVARQMYQFAISTWGLGVLGFVLFIKNVRKSVKLTAFSAFVYLTAVFNLIIDITAITPLVLTAIICCVCLYDLELRDILYAITATGFIFTAYFSQFMESVGNAEFITISIVFCMMAAIIVIVCCGGRYRVKIMSGAIAGIVVYSCVYMYAVTLPHENKQMSEYNAYIYKMSGLIYNSKDAPPVVVIDDWAAEILQFLNQNADIRTEVGELESYFRVYFLSYTTPVIIAIGERAELYAASQQE
jgi:hypothetical protein